MLLAVAAPATVRAQSPATPPAADAAAASQKEGREHFARGIALYREANFSGARAEFERAYDVAPSYRILFNLGETAFELQDYAGAIMAFSRYLSEGGTAVPALRRTEVEKSIGELEQRVGRLVVSTNVAGADIAVDGVRVGTTPLAAPVVVSVGRRALTATMTGRIPISRTIDVAGGDRTNIVLDLAVPEVAVTPTPAPVVAVQPEPAAVPPPSPAPPPAHSKPSMTPFWIGVAATGALTVASATFGALTIGANSTLNDRLNAFPGSASSISSARTQVHSFALAADILGGTAIAAAGVTVYLGVSRRSSAAPASVGFGPGSARLRVTF
jgi:PEGA domain